MQSPQPFIRLYEPTDLEGCRRCFVSNVPLFFLEEEQAPFEDFLQERMPTDPQLMPYYVLILEREIIGCGGLGRNENGTVSFTWGMVHRDFHKQGFGEMLLQYRLQQSAILFPGLPLRLDTTQHSVGFFEKYGFQTVKYTPDGYAPDMHRYDMVLGITD